VEIFWDWPRAKDILFLKSLREKQNDFITQLENEMNREPVLL
jgi:hypothetical protein